MLLVPHVPGLTYKAIVTVLSIKLLQIIYCSCELLLGCTSSSCCDLYCLVLLAYSLKKRPYIGPTSMDPEMAFIMCNMAQASLTRI